MAALTCAFNFCRLRGYIGEPRAAQRLAKVREMMPPPPSSLETLRQSPTQRIRVHDLNMRLRFFVTLRYCIQCNGKRLGNFLILRLIMLLLLSFFLSSDFLTANSF